MREASGEVRLARGGGRGRDDIRAVDERARVLAEHGHLRERGLERALQLRLVVHERLPLAGRTLVAREQAVGLETELAAERRLDLTLVAAVAGEESAAELSLDEELGVEQLGGGVERRSRNGRVNVVSSSDRVPVSRTLVSRRDRCSGGYVRGEESNDLGGGELASIGEASENLGDVVKRLGDRQVGRGLGRVLAANKDVEAGRAWAVGDTDGTGQLDAASTSQQSNNIKPGIKKHTSRRW